MNKVIQNSFIALFLLALVAPSAQMYTRFFEEEKLHGVESNAKLPAPSFDLKSFIREEYQKNIIEWFDSNIGFRAHLVKTDNQLNYDLFHMLSTSYASPIAIGRNEHLFERLYIERYNFRHRLKDNELNRITRRLKKLQSGFQNRQIAFLLIISPSKATIYSEFLPKKHIKDSAKDQSVSNYNRIVPLLKNQGVNVFDTREYLLQIKSSTNFPLFAKGGSHWTQYTACQVSAELAKRVSELIKRTVPTISCQPYEVKQPPEPFDRDLADLANVWDPSPFYEPLAYPIIPAKVEIKDYQPKMLFIGGSFLWTILYYFENFEVHSSRNMFYYYSRDFQYPEDRVEPIERKTLDWQSKVFSKDIVILEVNEAGFDRIGNGFISDAISRLASSQKPLHGE